MLTLMPTFTSGTDHPEIDPVIELATMFKENKVPFSMLFTNQMPDLRRLLYQVGLETFSWANVYDDIQGIHMKSGMPFTIEDLVLPKDAIPYFLGRDVFYFQGSKKVMQAHFHKEGFVYWVERRLPSGEVVKEQYDDRGFVTTRTVTQADGHWETFWLDDKGYVVLTQTSQKITVADSQKGRFAAASYQSVQEIVYEFLMKQSMQLQQSPPIVTDLETDTLELRSGQPFLKQMIFLVNQKHELTAKDLIQINDEDVFVFPTSADEQLFVRQAEARGNKAKADQVAKYVIPQYATTLNLGLSNETALDSIYWRLGNIQDDEARRLLIQLIKVLQHEDDQALIVEGSEGQVKKMSDHLQAFIKSTFDVDLTSEQYQEVAQFVADQRSGKPIAGLDKRGKKLRELPNWQALSAAEYVASRIHLQVAKRDIQEALMHQARVYVDTATIPDLRMMIEAISNGVPLVVRQSSTLIREHQNGIVITDLAAIPEACRFFLKTLSNWNQSLVANAELIEKFSADHLIKKWQEVIAFGES